jgi:uncharacterized FlaG/YvyC family protein
MKNNAIKKVILIRSEPGESLEDFEEKINKRLRYLQGDVKNMVDEHFDVEIIDIKLTSDANCYTAMIVLEMGKR